MGWEIRCFNTFIINIYVVNILKKLFYGFYPKLALKDHNGLEINKWFEVDLPNTCLSSDIISNFLFWVNKFIRKLRLKYPFTDTDWFRRPNALFYFGYWQNKEYFLFYRNTKI